MHMIHDRIWTSNGAGELLVRPGRVDLDPVESAELFEIPPYILHVSGLVPTDFAVFLETEAFNSQSESHGYLVTSVEEETGDGILVLGDAVEADPQTWMSKRLADMMLLLGEEQIAEFNLSGLYHAVLRAKAA